MEQREEMIREIIRKLASKHLAQSVSGNEIIQAVKRAEWKKSSSSSCSGAPGAQSISQVSTLVPLSESGVQRL